MGCIESKLIDIFDRNESTQNERQKLCDLSENHSKRNNDKLNLKHT